MDSLSRRFLDTGFTTGRALTLKEIRQRYISREELERWILNLLIAYMLLIMSRVSQLEMLDEVEELDLVLGHYAVSWGTLLLGNKLGTKWCDWGLKIL